jgi:2-dehydro-3-deoxygluconokinase
VIYDRAFSSFWELKPGMLDWEAILDGITWFHFSAICPALNENLAAVCREGLEIAKGKGILVSLDLNYRAKLWQYGKTPLEVMPALVQYCDVLMGNLWAEEKMLGISLPSIEDKKEAYLAQSEIISRKIHQKFPNCRQVANTFRFDEGGGIRYYATLYSEAKLTVSPEFSSDRIIDKVGSGDCFMAGLIYGNYHQHSAQEIISFSASAAFQKLFIQGDATTASVEQINREIVNYV